MSFSCVRCRKCDHDHAHTIARSCTCAPLWPSNAHVRPDGVRPSDARTWPDVDDEEVARDEWIDTSEQTTLAMSGVFGVCHFCSLSPCKAASELNGTYALVCTQDRRRTNSSSSGVHAFASIPARKKYLNWREREGIVCLSAADIPWAE
jgi:hypothetical protein